MLYGIFGAGGFGREVMWLAQQSCQAQHGAADDFDLCFIEHAPRAQSVDGMRLLSLAEFAAIRSTERRFNVAIADPTTRQRIVTECEALELEAFTIRGPHAEVHPTATIEAGAVLCQFTLVSANARVGRHFHLNHHGYVSHDCRIGDFVTFAPAVRCNGAVEICDAAYIGSGAVIHQSTPLRAMRIGARATIGMGAVVLQPVPDGVTVAGNPARPLG